jgi:hypothetical protein
VKHIRKRVTYANVMSSIAVFLVLGGATAYAAKKIGSNEIKSNSITTGKIKKNAVTSAKIKKNAITSAKIKNGAVTGAKINTSTIGTVPSASNSATTDVIKTSKGTVGLNQQATALQYGPFSIVIRCFDSDEPAPDGDIEARAYITSSTPGSVFASWEDGSKNLGPDTPENERQLNGASWADSTGPFGYDGPSDANVSATATNGQGFNAYVGLASEKDTGTCWWWLNATILG